MRVLLSRKIQEDSGIEGDAMTLSLKIVVVTDRNEGVQALYLDGTLIICEDRLCAQDIVHAADGQSAVMSHEFFDLPENAQWPLTLDELETNE